MKRRTQNIIIYNIFSLIFSFILFHIYKFTAWQSNFIWIFISYTSASFSISQSIFEFFKKNKFMLIFSDVILSFCLVGNYLFVFPLDKSVRIISVLEYVIFTISCSPIIIFVSLLFNSTLIKVVKNKTENKKVVRWHLIIYTLIPIVIGIISMIALNPCIVSYDAYEVLAEAKKLTPVNDYAGILYVLWFRILLSIIDSVVFICIVQILIYSVTIGFFFYYFEKRFNLKFIFLFSTLLCFSILPNNIMMLITLTKDVYYAIFLALMIFAFILLQERESIRNFIFLGIVLFLVWSIRQSGILAIIFVVIIGFFIVEKRKIYGITVIVFIIFSLCVNFCFVKMTKADPVPRGLKYVALYQDILGVYYSGGKLSDETNALIVKGVGKTPEFKDSYTPYWAYYDYYYIELEDEKITHFIKCYINTFFRNPILMTRAILCRLDMMWDIRPGLNAFESWQWRVVNTGGQWTKIVTKRRENSLSRLYNKFGEKSKQFPFKDIIWRVAILNVVFVLLLFHIKEKKYYLVFLPFFGFTIAYIVSLGWSHYRYYWANEIIMLMNFLYIISNIKSEEDVLVE